MVALDKNDAWYLFDLPIGINLVGRKWVFKKTLNVEGNVENYKAHLVAKGYSRVEGIDFGDIFSHVAKLTSIIFIFLVIATFYIEVEKTDVNTTFLHGDLEEEIYMKQLEGFAVKGKKEMVYKMKNSLYGLKQSPRIWYEIFDTHILGLGFTSIKYYHYVYFKLVGDHFIYMVM
jgi:ATP-binding cassette subfamily B (MDR/TAP) protein 1